MERELKFLLERPHAPELPVGYHLDSGIETSQLMDEYLDDRGQILAAGWRLRSRRTGNDALRFTLKSVPHRGAANSLSERLEIEEPAVDGAALPEGISLELARSGIDTVRLPMRLQPYLSIRQERRTSSVADRDGELALLSIDEVRAKGSLAEEEHRWTELEIEFLPTASAERIRRAVDAITASFRLQSGVVEGGEPKVERAARLLSISL